MSEKQSEKQTARTLTGLECWSCEQQRVHISLDAGGNNAFACEHCGETSTKWTWVARDGEPVPVTAPF
jgi:hypothetical protein